MFRSACYGVAMVLVIGLSGTLLQAADLPLSAQVTAEKVLADWYATFAGAKNVTGEFDAKIEATGKGTPKSEITAYRLVVERPNKLLVATTRGAGLAVVADDKQVYEYLAAKKKYHVKDKPLESFAKLDSAPVLSYANYGLGLNIVDAALRAADFNAFYATFSSPEYVGLESRVGPATHHLRLTRDSVPYDVWFTDADKKLLRVAVADMRPVLQKLSEREPMTTAKPGETPPPKAGEFPPEVNVSMTVTYKNWRYDGNLLATAFKIPPAPGAELVYDIFAEPDHPLLGKRAPGFATRTLQGQPLAASALAGKVVMLDFWATWCPPCVAALPKVNETATKYRDKGVVFLAVNQGEDPADINDFLVAQKLNVPVVMDPDGAIAKLYAVSGIPQTVIIDAKGMVQSVHVGAGANIGEQLARELDDVLAGKDLLAKTLKK